MFTQVRRAFFRATIALLWFEAANPFGDDDGAAFVERRRVQSEESKQRHRAAERVYETSSGRPAFDWDDDAPQIEVERLALSIAEAQSVVPSSFRAQFPFMHAESFVFALDGIEKLMSVIAGWEGAPSEAIETFRVWSTEFPQLRDIRNSAHHTEDRIRGIGKPGKVMNVPVIDMGNLGGSEFSITVADGSVQTIDVSLSTLVRAQVLVQQMHDAFVWTAPGWIDPRG